MDINSNLYNAYTDIQQRMKESADNIAKNRDVEENLIELKEDETQAKAVTKAMETEKGRVGTLLDMFA